MNKSPLGSVQDPDPQQVAHRALGKLPAEVFARDRRYGKAGTRGSLLGNGNNVPLGIYFMIDETAMKAMMRSELIFTGSDGLTAPDQGSYGHPRSAGTFARKLRFYAMDCGIMTLQNAILSMTSRPAEKFGLKERGKITPGFFADIAVIDLARLRDKADYQNPFDYAEGVQHVLVNGVLEVENGAFTGLRNGRAIRRL